MINAISKYIKVSDDLRKELETRISFVTFKKREVVLTKYEVCTKSFFIQKGIFRLFYYKDEKEISEFFFAENQWVNSPKSFINQEVDEYYIDAIEDAEAWSIHVRDLVYLFDHYPEMERYARLDMGATFIHVLERLAISRFSTAQERYKYYLTTYREIHHRIPLGMAASYIGVTQETLSRLRRNNTF